ncbi:MAG: hypothetical protein IPG08_14005 [Sphingobacteriaceae bacterium]|nr:hypothetical protein [Sphingobacteriaceae bacterium]
MNQVDIDKISLDKSESRIIEPGIILNTFKEGIMLETEDLLATKSANLKLANGKRYGVILSFGYLANITKETRDLAASEKFKQNTVVLAILTHSTGQRLMGNFYLNFNKPISPTKLFNNLDKAKEWMQEMLKESGVLEEWK